MDNDKWLKGDAFQNRYRITGTLTTISPLHIGTGEATLGIPHTIDPTKPKAKSAEPPPLVSRVAKDHEGRPIIPGSALKGVMRHWLLSVLTAMDPKDHKWAVDRDFTAPDLTDLSQNEQIARVKNEFSWLELVFGTPFHEGKIEVWDAVCATPSLSAPDNLLNWNSQSLTYEDTSVAIDPETGTAEEHLLYKAEVVPPGILFDLNIVGQNLTNTELGLLLLTLQGFNSTIYPIRVGARGGRGFGRVQFIPGDIYVLRQGQIKEWIQATVTSYAPSGEVKPDEKNAAGYFALPQLSMEEQNKLIAQVKDELIKQLGG